MATTETPVYKSLVAEAQTQALSSLKEAQDLWLKATEAAVGLLPDASTPELPTAKDIVTQSFAFGTKVFEAQKEFAVRLAEILDTAAAKITPKA